MPHLLRRALRALSDFGSRPRPRIFISYRRRGEGAGYAGRLADRLVHEFGADQCFRDIDDIETGTDFVDEISRAVGGCEVLIVVIGPDWLEARDRDGLRRLDDPRDFVRIEVAAALARGIRVVPVLVGGAAVPPADKLPSTIEGLARRQAHELSDSRWEFDMGQLISAIEAMGVHRRTRPRTQGSRRWKRAAMAAVTTAVTAAVAVPAAQALRREWTPSQPESREPKFESRTVTSQTTMGDSALLDNVNDLMESMLGRMPAQAVSTVSTHDAGDKGQNTRRSDARRDDILAAMRRANDAETHAMRTHDIDVLESGFTGEALQLEVYALAALRTAGQRSANLLHDQRILSMDVSADGNHAVVEAVETWSSTHYDAITDACLYRLAPSRVPQTVHLVRLDGRWIVSGIATRGETAEELPCT